MGMKASVALLFVAIVCVSGCSTMGGWFSEPSTHKPTPLSDNISVEQSMVLKWSKSIGKASVGGFTPRYFNGSLYAADETGKVSVFDITSGQSIGGWEYRKTSFNTGLAVNESAIYVATDKGELLALAKSNGDVLWRQQLTSLLLEAPLLMPNGVLVVRVNDGRVTGFNAADGRQLWSNANSLPPLLIRNTGSMAPVDGQSFLLGLPAGRLQAIHASNGNVLWEVMVASPRGATELDRATDIVSYPLYDNGQICAVAFQGRVACFDIRTGDQQWAQDISSSKGITVNESSVFVTADDGSVQAFDRLTGQRQWKQDSLLYRGVSAPALLGAYVFVIDMEGFAHLISAQTGSIVGRLKTDIGEIASSPQSFGETVLLQGSNGRLAYIALGNK